MKALKRLTADNPSQQERLGILEGIAEQRLSTLAEGVRRRRDEGFDSAEQVVLTGQGKQQMDAVRSLIAEAVQVEDQLLLEREREANTGTTRTFVTFIAGLALSFVLLLLVFYQLNHEIGARRRAEEEARYTSRQLEAANKELEAFSYSVSHDLRAPLRHINGFSQALLEDYADKLDDEGKGYLRQVRGASQEMAQLIDDVLQLARVTRSEMRRETVSLSELARTIVSELREREPNRTVNVQVEENLSARGDKRLLKIMLVNLLGNAWKFTSKREDAEIAFGQKKKDGETVFFVRDNGAGFDMAYAGKLFGAFQRLHSGNEFEGTGIGLATVQRIINRHAGRVWAEGVVGKGATFNFTLADPKETKNGEQSDSTGGRQSKR
jgi:signal transduction histidine kinase